LPQQSAVESRYREYEISPGREKPKTQPTWGDSFYQRIYGDEEGYVAADRDFDKTDFQLIFALERPCDHLDKETAKTLYAKVHEPSEPAATPIATKDQQDFPRRRDEVLSSVLKSMSRSCQPRPSPRLSLNLRRAAAVARLSRRVRNSMRPSTRRKSSRWMR